MMKSPFKINRSIIALLLVVTAFVVGYFIFINPKTVRKNENEKLEGAQSIAVLPFINMSNEPEQEYFSDGLADGILNAIAHLKGLKV